MADPRFYTVSGPFNINHLVESCGAELGGRINPDAIYEDVATLSQGTPTSVSFIDNRKYVSDFRASNAGAIITPPELVDQAPDNATLLITNEPYKAYATIAGLFYPTADSEIQISPSATVEQTASVGEGSVIEHGAVVKSGVTIGANSFIGANVVMEANVSIGEGSIVKSNASLSYCLIGSYAIIHPGVRIGQDGYGFAPGHPHHKKVPQLGRVIIGDHVEIGANSCIDRGAILDTEIGDGTKIDNLVHIAHNVKVGKGCFITGQVGIAGSSTIGDFVMMGGQAGVSGHVNIGDGAKLAAQAGVSKDIPAGETVAGYPAMNARKFWKNMAVLNKLASRK